VQPKPIQSSQNPTIKAVAKLRTSRGRKQQNRIIIDGEREVLRALESGIALEAVFVPAEQRDVSAVSDWQAKQDGAFDVYVVKKQAFSKIAFGNRQEVVAIAPTPVRDLDSFRLPKNGTIGVLERIEKPGNVGAVLRSADGAGLDGIICVDPGTDLFNPNAIRASLGTIFSTQIAVASFEQFEAWSNKNALHHFLAKCDASAQPYDDPSVYLDVSDSPVSIVLGSESQGLSGNWDRLPRARSLTIPMRGSVDSLNIAASAAVFFYEVQRHRQFG
jgi:TrmH family RNA methyltransferase